jgi:hypothetical protein
LPYPKGKPRPAGAGRKKGTPNKATAAKVAAIAASGLTPLDFMLGVMRDESRDVAVRLDAARSAAPYVHPKLSAVEHSGKDGGPVRVEVVVKRDTLFYGRSPAARAPAESVTHSGEHGPLQNGRLRAAVGEDGPRPDGGG